MSITFLNEESFTDQTGRAITIIVTAISMALSFTLIPLLPQPLPVIVALLVAYLVYRDPPMGAFVGSMIIAFGVFYHLSRIGFFLLFPPPWVRMLVMVVLLLPFFLVSTQLFTNIAIISMDIGILAVSLLFFKSTYYLAIPIILVFATIYRKRGLIVTFSYYLFISLPLQIMQYLKTFQVGMVPPLYTPLDVVFTDIQQAMEQVSLEEIQKILGVIMRQILMVNGNGGELQPALSSYVNSLPGMIFFILIISALISVAALLTLKLPEPLKRSRLPRRYMDVLIYVIPVGVAIFTNVVFFVLLDILQGPLAFQASVDPTILMLSTSFTLFLSAPVSLSKYIVDLRDVLADRKAELKNKAESLLEEAEHYIWLMNLLGDPIPQGFISLHTRMLIVADELKDTIVLSSDGLSTLKEVDPLMRRVFTHLQEEVSNFRWQLDIALDDYYIKIKFEFLESAREIRELGLEVKLPEINDPPKDAPLDEKVESILWVIDAGGNLVETLISTSDKIYEIICSLFEPSLPGVSPIIQISKEKQESDEPWVIIDAILASLRNWEKQYSAEILRSTKPIQDSVDAVIELRKREGALLPILGDRFTLISDLAGKLEVRDFGRDDDLKVLRVILIRDTIFSTVDVVARVVGVLYDHLRELEADIDSLMPMEDYEWNKNLTLLDRMNTSLGVINRYESHEINEIISHLYRVLSYIDEAVDTVQYYNERKELLLNYRILEKKIGRILADNDQVSLDDLGVSEKFGREYLKLYLRGHYTEIPLEEVGSGLRRVG